MCRQCTTPEHEVLCRHVQALMLAASVDCTEGLSLLIKHGATIELQVNLYLVLPTQAWPFSMWHCEATEASQLPRKACLVLPMGSAVGCSQASGLDVCLPIQDALGRTALMFAAGSSADAAVRVLLDAGASLAARDRRNKGIMDYAGDDSPVRALLEERHACCWHCYSVQIFFQPVMNPGDNAPCPMRLFVLPDTSLMAASVLDHLCGASLTPGITVLCNCLVQDDCAGSGS